MKKKLIAAACVTGLATPLLAEGYSGDEIKIGVLTAFSGAAAAVDGEGAVVAAQMAVDDFGGAVNGTPVVVLQADHQSKPDVALTVARKWFDEDGVDMITNLNLSNIALATMTLAEEKQRNVIVTGAVSSAITGAECQPLTVHWTMDTYAQTSGLPTAVVKNGGDKWFFITVDYAFGKALETDASTAVVAAGGEIMGTVTHPFENTDFSSLVLQAQSSGANVVGLANSGADTNNTIKQAKEFGLDQTLVPFFFYAKDARAIGLDTAQGIQSQLAFYWDQNEETRAFAERFMERTGEMPTNNQAMQYTGVLHYLKAVEAAGTDEAATVRQAMGNLPINDMATTDGEVRADGRAVRDYNLYQVRSPAESTGEWDVFKLVAPSDRAALFVAPENSACGLFNQ